MGDTLSVEEKAALYDILDELCVLEHVSIEHRKSRKKGGGNKWISDGWYINYLCEAFDGEYSSCLVSQEQVDLLIRAGFNKR
jgi:hypothetical protein